MEYLVDESGSLAQVISGGGSSVESLGDDPSPLSHFSDPTLGFALLEFEQSKLTVMFYDDSATLLHEEVILKT